MEIKTLAVRRRNGHYGLMQFGADPSRFLFDDGITRVPTEQELAEGIALIIKWNREMEENKIKKAERYARSEVKYKARLEREKIEKKRLQRRTAALAKKGLTLLPSCAIINP
jgi:hypothetical protein